MTESQFTQKLRRALQAKMPQAVVWKFADRYTAGIPDLCVINNGLSIWFELKVGSNRATPLQWHMLKKIKFGFLVEARQGKFYVTWAHGATVKIFDTFNDLVDNLVAKCS